MSTNQTTGTPSVDGLGGDGGLPEGGVRVAQAGSTASDGVRVIEVAPGSQIDLSDVSLEGSSMTLDGQNLVLTLGDGTQIVLQDFVTAVASDNPPSFTFGGGLQMTAADMLSNADIAPGDEQVAEGEQIGDIAPAGGGPDDDGTTVAPEAQGPIGPGADPTGPLGPTSLAFTAPFPELDVVFLAPLAAEEAVEEEICPEITCAELFSGYMASWSGPVSGRVSPDDVPSESSFDHVAVSGSDLFVGTPGTDLLIGKWGEQAILGLGDDDWILASGEGAFNAVHGDTPFVYSVGEGGPDLPVVAAQADIGFPSFHGEGGAPGDDVIFGGDHPGQLEVLAGGAGNDYIDGQAGHELIVGDEVALTYQGVDFFSGGPKNGSSSLNTFLQIGESRLSASDVFDERSDNYNDVLFSGDGHAIMVGDVAVSGIQEETDYQYGEGGEYNETDSEWSLAFSEGVSLEAGAFDGGSVNAFNDFIDAELAVYGEGPVEETLLGFGGIGEGDFGSALIGDVAALGSVGGYFGGGIKLTANMGSFFLTGEGADPDGGSVTAFNDALCGTEASDLLVGDVLQVGFGGYGEGDNQWIGLSAEGFATSGGAIDAYNDTLLGQGGHDVLVGDVMTVGLGEGGNVDLEVFNFAEGWGNTTRDADGNTFTAFNDRMRPGEGYDVSVGDVFVTGGKQKIDLWAGNKVWGYPWGSYGEGGASADDNTFYAYNDEICDDSGSGVAVGDVFAEGADNSVWVGASNYAGGSYGEGNSASGNTFTVYSDVLHGDHGSYGEGSVLRIGSELVGDVKMEDDGQYYGASANLWLSNYADGMSSHSDQGIYSDPRGGVASNNTFNAFNDSLMGTHGYDRLIGDLSLDANMAEGSLYVENWARGSNSPNSDGGEANGNTFNAFNDEIVGFEGPDYAVGDAWVNGYIEGGDREWPYHSREGVELVTANYAAGAYGEGGEANGNTFNTFNDAIDIGSGGGVAVGDLYFHGFGEGDIDLDVVNVAEGAGGDWGGQYGVDGGEASNNTFNAFNDTITGGIAEGYLQPQAQGQVQAAAVLFPFVTETLVGDVMFSGEGYCDKPEIELQVHNMADDGRAHGFYGEGGTADNNTFNAYNDVMIGGPEEGPVIQLSEGGEIALEPFGIDLMVGDVLAEGAGDIDLEVHNHANDDYPSAYMPATSASDNTFNAFNDEMTLGFGEGLMVGDVFAEGSCDDCGDGLNVELVAHNYAGYQAAATGNTFNVFNDVMTGHDYDDFMVGDVYVWGDELEYLNMRLENETYEGGANYGYTDASGTTFSAFNDQIFGRDGNNKLVGDIYFDGDDNDDDCFSYIKLEAFGTYGTVGEGDDLFSDRFTAWSDTIEGGADNDWMVGDGAIGFGEGELEIEVGGYYADGEYSLFNDTMNGFGEGDEMVGDFWLWGEGNLDVNVEGTSYPDEGAPAGTFTMFNDTMDGGDDTDCMIGDIVYDDAEYTPWDENKIELDGVGDFSLFNDTMEGGADDDYMVGDILFDSFEEDFNVDIEGYGEGGYGSFELFSDDMNGGAGDDVMFGDFFWGGSVSDLKKFDHDQVEGSGFKFEDMLEYQGDMFFDFKIDGGFEAGDVTIFSDILVGGDGDDHLIGQFGADRLTGGAGADTFWFGEGDGSEPTEAISHQEINGNLGDLEDVIGEHILEGSLNPGDVITDFEVGTDHIGLYGDLDYDDLNITNDANGNAVMAVGTGEILATVLGVSADELDNPANFIHV